MTFPLLNLPDLVSCVASELPDLELNEDDFTTPNAIKWHEVYMMILAHMTGNTFSNVKTSINRRIAVIDHADLHRTGIESSILARCLNRVLVPAGIDNFSLKDIVFPQKKRLMRVMSAVINYIRYKTERQPDFEETNELAQKRLENHDMLLAQRDAVCQKINDIKRTQAEQQEKIAALRDKKETLLSFIAEQQRQSDGINKKVKDVKTKSQIIDAEVKNCTDSIASLTRERDRLESMIVQSPDRAASENASMESKLAQINLTYDEKLTRLHGLSKAIQRQRSEECCQANKLLDSLNEPAARMRQIAIDMKRLIDEQQQRSTQTADLTAKIESAKCTMTARHEKFEKLKLQQRMKEDSMKRHRQELQLIHDQLCGDDDILRAIAEEHEQFLRKDSAERDEFRTRMETIERSKQSVIEDVETFNKDFILALKQY